LTLKDVLISAVCHCAPPDNKPTREEVASCSGFLQESLALRQWTAILCLGGIAWEHTLRALGARRSPFGHGAELSIGGTRIHGSYHPSQQNTFTGRLTQEMLQSVVDRFVS
jgi:uracil-DNA glycosylase family 4